MGAVAIDLNNPAEVITIGRRVLVDALGAEAARVFINSCANERNNRPRITAERMAEIMAESRAKAEAGRGKGIGDYTAERYNEPQLSHDELVAAFDKYEDEMDAIKREHPEYSLRELLNEKTRREQERRRSGQTVMA
jgi:hypothetical protein